MRRSRPADAWCPSFDLTGDMVRFVDVGSGYGKVVAHVAIENSVRAVGIECVISRHELAEQALQEAKVELLLNPPAPSRAPSKTVATCAVEGGTLAGAGGGRRAGKRRARSKAGAESSATDDTAAAEEATAAAAVEQAAAAAEVAGGGGTDGAEGEVADATSIDGPLALISLHFGDATFGRCLDFSHIYCFDRVFSPVTMRALARLLQRSPFRVFVSYRAPSEWWDHGLTCIHPVAKVRVKTTGNEGYSPIVYINLRFAPRL